MKNSHQHKIIRKLGKKSAVVKVQTGTNSHHAPQKGAQKK